MNITEFFIRRPVFAIIVNFIVILIGLLSYNQLTLREYPDISIPTVSVDYFYPNASANIVEQELTFPIEQSLIALEGLDQMTSTSRDEVLSVKLKFSSKRPLGEVVTDIRDKLAMLKARLPQEVKEPNLRKSAKDDEIMYLSLVSNEFSFSDIVHYANVNLKNKLQSVNGVSVAQIIGPSYKMQVNLDHKKLYSYGISVPEVIDVIRKNNILLPGGKINDAIPVTVDLSLDQVNDFENLIVKHDQGQFVMLKDIAKVELVNTDYLRVRVNGQNAVLIGITPTSDANILDVTKQVSKIVPELSKNLPDHLKLNVDYDKSLVVQESLDVIYHSIIEAIILVMVIVFIFLRNLRASFIPIVTIPIALIGALFIMKVMGFSINTLSMLGIVLAVGLVVDDAIVVLENIHRHIEEGLSPFEAAIKGGKEIGFAIIAMTLTLASVYAPIAFIGGVTGELFVEFALTLAGAVIISGMTALTLSPMMCSKLLKAPGVSESAPKNQFLERIFSAYERLLEKVLKRQKLIVFSSFVIFGLTILLYQQIPSSVAVTEDRGVVGGYTPFLQNISMDQFDEYMKLVETQAQKIKEKREIISIIEEDGGNVILPLVKKNKRSKSSIELKDELAELFKKVPSATTYAWNWDTGLPGLSNSNNITDSLEVAVVTVSPYDELNQVMNNLVKACQNISIYESCRSSLNMDVVSMKADIDTSTMSALGLEPEKVSEILISHLGEMTHIKYRKEGQKYDIGLEVDDNPYTADEIYTQDAEGNHISLGSFVQFKRQAQANALEHHNALRAAYLEIELKKGVSLEDALKVTRKFFKRNLPSTFNFEYGKAVKQLMESQKTLVLLIVTAIIFIYCILAIQFESFIDPLIILFTVPLAGFGALLPVWLLDNSLNIFNQIGLITLIGLITKHGILLVEFANQQREQGKEILEAIKISAQIRVRPIFMTTCAMIFGIIPLALSSASGSEARQSIALVLISGLVFGTMLTLLILPTLYVQVKRLAQD